MILRVSPEYGCWPTWVVQDGESSSNVNPRELPISEELAVELVAWDEQFQATLNQDYPPWSGFADLDAVSEWLTRGKSLVSRLERSLTATSLRVASNLDGADASELIARRED